MQGVEHVNKLMKLTMVSQVTAANNNRRDADGQRLLGDVAQTAVAIVSRSHIVNGPRAASLPSDQYSLMLQGKMGWGTAESVERHAKGEHKMFQAGSVSRLGAMQAGLYSPPQRTAAVSPEPMALLLANPSRKRRFEIRPSPLGAATVEEDPGCAHSSFEREK